MRLQTYDPDADQQHAPGGHDNLGVSPEQAAAETADLENRFAADAAPEPGSEKSADSTSLKNSEEEAPYGSSAADDINDRLGKGYRGDKSKKTGTSKLFNSDSKLKKKIAIAGAAAGGSVIIGIIIFLALLPLKIEHIVANLESKFGAASASAIDKETGNLLSDYMTKHVLPNLNKPGCKTTASSGCVSFDPGANPSPVGKLFASWKQGRLEQKLATKYDLAFARKGNTFYMNTHGSSLDIGTANASGSISSIFGDSHTTAKTRTEIRQAVRDSMKDATLYDKVFFRFKIGKLLESKYGIKRCIIACNIRDKFADARSVKLNAAKGYIIQRVISPLSESYGLILQCVIDGGCDVNPNQTTTADNGGDQERTSKFQQNLQAQLDSFAEKYGKDALDTIIKDTNTLSDKGFNRYVIGKIAAKVGVQEGTDKALDSALPVLGWVNFASKTLGRLNGLGPKLKALNYAAASAGAVQLYMTYRTVADETHSGHTDLTEIGSFANSLGDNLQQDGNGADVTKAPLYNSLMGGGSSSPTQTALVDSLLGGTAYADSTANGYKCNDGSSVPTGKLVCDEENLSGGSAVANAITNITNNIPGWQFVNGVVDVWNSTIGQAFQKLSDVSSGVANWLIDHVPGLNQFGGIVAGLISPLLAALTKYLIPSPFSDNMSGGRTFDMMAAGADVSMNKSCQVQLGCAKLSDQQVAGIRNQQVAEEKATFDHQSIFARMFDTSSSYSLMSRLAMDMPTNMLTATNTGVSSLFTNPLSKVGGVFSGIFTGNQAFAATAAQPDPFGVDQYGITDTQIDQIDAEAQKAGGYDQYYQQKCSDGSFTQAWLNNQQANDSTGEAVSTDVNPCLLIGSIAQTAGAIFDPSTLPAGSTNGNTTSTTSSTGSQVSGDAATLAKQVLANANITLGPTAKADVEAASNNQKVIPGPIDSGGAGTTPCAARTPVFIDATLLQAMLNIAQKYKYQIQDIISGHNCDSGRHPLGRAMDIFQVNGAAINWGGQPTKDFTNYVITTMAALLPNGKFVNSRPVNMAGIGIGDSSCIALSAFTPPSNINYFPDACDELHVDVGVAP